MSIFQDVTLSFANKEYKIEANSIMRCLAQIEDVISLAELTNKTHVPMVKLSMAYGIALRYAGATVSDEDIYANVFEPGSAHVVQEAVSGLLLMMIPPAKYQNSVTSTDEKKSKRKRKN